MGRLKLFIVIPPGACEVSLAHTSVLSPRRPRGQRVSSILTLVSRKSKTGWVNEPVQREHGEIRFPGCRRIRGRRVS
jgi:hypothetical protein